MKQINRRELLKLAAGVAAATALPAPGLPMQRPHPPALPPASTTTRGLLTPSIIVREMILQLSKYNEIRVGIRELTPLHRDPKLGDQVRVRGYPPATMDQQQNVTWESKSADLVLSIDDFSDRFIVPTAKAITTAMLEEAKHRELGHGAVVMGPLPVESWQPFAAQAEWSGYAARLLRDYSINTDAMLMRIDVLYGFTGRA